MNWVQATYDLRPLHLYAGCSSAFDAPAGPHWRPDRNLQRASPSLPGVFSIPAVPTLMKSARIGGASFSGALQTTASLTPPIRGEEAGTNEEITLTPVACGGRPFSGTRHQHPDTVSVLEALGQLRGPA